MTAILLRFRQLYEWILKTLVVVGGFLLVFMMMAVVVEVAMRFFIGRPTTWVIEITSYILLFLPFLAGAWILKHDGHVKMDLLLSRLRPKYQHGLNAITSIVGVGICAVLTVYGIRITINLYELNIRTPTSLMIPKSWIISVIFVGSFFMGIQFIIRAVDNYKAWRFLQAEAGVDSTPAVSKSADHEVGP